MAVQINVAANQAALTASIQAGVQAYNQRFAQNGVDTFISEYYFDNSGRDSYSGNFIGSFSSNLQNGETANERETRITHDCM